MTAPAAAQFRRTTPAQMAAQPARQARVSAQDPRDSASFAAHLERGTPDRHRTERSPSAGTRPASAPPHAARSDPAAPAPSRNEASTDAAAEAATGKVLPDKRQNLAETRNQAAFARIGEPGVAEDETARADATTTEGTAQTATTSESGQPLPALLIANLPAPALALPANGGTAARLGAMPQINAERPQIGSDQLSALPANAAPALATPATAFVLEREAAQADAAVPAAATIQSGPVESPGTLQNAARAEPSAFVTLTGAADQDPA
ncbi:hypothetical protein, partial [Novosphingobium sp.]|uniref:hypothetical protein n=1 Tax=Novosphingobium sp. TaxID=1874826 RepID=UPI0026195D36